MPAIGQHRLLSKSAEDVKYQWQDKAYKATKAFSKESEKLGFFGINMASTGCGKTIANARIMYALSDERDGCRFSVALGLRTLTMQTGDAYRALLKLGDDELAVLIGSNAVKLLHQLDKDEKKTPLQPMVVNQYRMITNTSLLAMKDRFMMAVLNGGYLVALS